MSLESWFANGWLQRFELSDEEILAALRAAEADLHDARKDLSPAWRFAIAYNAALRLCSLLLGKAGYRAAREQKHYRTIAALPLVLGPDAGDLASFLDACRTKRHEVTYESLSPISAEEAEALIDAVEQLSALTRKHLNLDS